MQAQVLYEYAAQDGDQLTIEKGEIIEILDDSEDLNGWALAKKGEKEGYVPADYVRYIEQQPYENFVLVPCPCSRFSYTMSRPDLKRGAIFHLIIFLIVTLVDAFSIIAPCLPFGEEQSDTGKLVSICITTLNALCRVVLVCVHLSKYPRPELIFTTFPFLNVIASLTFSIRVYELLEMGDNKEYDGYRYARSWMYASMMNIPFATAALVLRILSSGGLIAIAVLVLVWNLLNTGRCFLQQWACKESGNDIHPDFEHVIRQYKL